MTVLRLLDVAYAYERARGLLRRETSPVLERVSLTVAPGEFIAVIGQSGSGKTTLLNLAAGFLHPTAGSVTLAGEPVKGPGADRAVVFQDDAVFPWLSVRDNVAFPLRMARQSDAERGRRANELLGLVGLTGYGDRAVWELSGGQRQRVGIARALAASPQFLLLDEPFGALDAMTRDSMQELILKVWEKSRAGALLITHSVEEALFLATRVIVMAPDPGRIVDSLSYDFGRRFLGGESARALKSDPEFIRAREILLGAIRPAEAEFA